MDNQQIVAQQIVPYVTPQRNRQPGEEHLGRPISFSVRCRRRRSKPDYIGPNKLEPTDGDYVGFKKVNVFILGSDKIKQYY